MFHFVLSKPQVIAITLLVQAAIGEKIVLGTIILGEISLGEMTSLLYWPLNVSVKKNKSRKDWQS